MVEKKLELGKPNNVTSTEGRGNGNDRWIFQRVVEGTTPPNKDAVEEALSNLGALYKRLGVRERDSARVISVFEADFYSGDRIEQTRIAARICSFQDVLRTVTGG